MGWGVRVVSIMLGAGAVGLAAARKKPAAGAKPASDAMPAPDAADANDTDDTEGAAAQRGYRLIDCTDVEVLDAQRAMAWAYELGQHSSMSQLLAELGGGCPLNQKIIEGLNASGAGKLRFMYDLARSALQGHVAAGASPIFANLALAQIRGEASKLGIDVASWPAGVA